MKKKIIILLIAFYPVFLLCQSELQSKVDQVVEIHKKFLEPPEHFFNDTLYRLDNDFNPMDYFKILSNIRLDSGLVLDYIFFYDTAGGTPLLYSRNVDSKPFINLNQYKVSVTT